MKIADVLCETNQNLLRYLSNRPIPTDHQNSEWFHEVWELFINDYLSSQNQERLSAFLGKPLNQTSFYDYYYLPPKTQRFFADFMERYGYDREMLHDDPHNAPAWMQLSPTQQRLLPRSTWLVHFTDHADEIAQQGFARGVENLDQLHLTRLGDAFGNVEHRTSDQPGYNFAYQVGVTDLDSRIGGYGANAVMFRSRGVPVYHAGDNEDQVIFYGPYVPRSRIVVLRHVGQTWRAEKNKQLLYQGRSLNRVAAWVSANTAS